MKVKIVKDHPVYSGTVEVDEARGQYLINVGIAEKAKAEKKEVKQAVEEKVEEFKPKSTKKVK